MRALDPTLFRQKPFGLCHAQGHDSASVSFEPRSPGCPNRPLGKTIPSFAARGNRSLMRASCPTPITKSNIAGRPGTCRGWRDTDSMHEFKQLIHPSLPLITTPESPRGVAVAYGDVQLRA